MTPQEDYQEEMNRKAWMPNCFIADDGAVIDLHCAFLLPSEQHQVVLVTTIIRRFVHHRPRTI